MQAKPDVLVDLPPTWVSEREVQAHPLEAKRYEELAAQLRNLHAARQQTDARLARLRRMHELLGPFASRDAVQPNLVTRKGEVERELERMKFLLARVGGRIEDLRDGSGADEARPCSRLGQQAYICTTV